MDSFSASLQLINETLAAIIVIVAASMLLYNLTRNLKNRVARTSGAMLTCVTIIYIADVLTSLEPRASIFEALLRFQWVGLAFIPATVFHLSDALLATTGLPSRGRRRLAIRILYIIAAILLLLATFTDQLVRFVAVNGRFSLQAASLFLIYLSYYIVANSVAFLNVQRARQRCLTRRTKRRMTYLQVAILTPIIGVFPYSVLLGAGEEFTVFALFVVNAANLVVFLMLLFLAYPLSFFGSRTPDRVVKAELLKFMLLGPATGVVALVVIIFTPPATQPLGIPGDAFMPFAVVAIILLWQWLVDLSLPTLERWLIYRSEDDDQLEKLQNLSDRLLTRSDLLQLVEATLEATCDYLRVNSAFALSMTDQKPELIRKIGDVDLSQILTGEEATALMNNFEVSEPDQMQHWQSYWIWALRSGRSTGFNGRAKFIGIVGIEARAQAFDLTPDESERLHTFIHRIESTLDDMILQTEIYAALEGLLPQITITRGRADEVQYLPGRQPTKPTNTSTLDREEVVEQVKAALRHFGGGPGISSSRLLELAVVRNALPQNDNNATKALRDVLMTAINNQKPDGDPDMQSQEWMTYNILTLRFIENRKVRETAQRLYMSEANLYRKQNIALEAVADAIIQMEEDTLKRFQQALPEAIS